MEKLRKYLYKEEAISLGFKPKEDEPLRNMARYYISKDDYEAILYNRSIPKERNFVKTIQKLNKNGDVVSSVEKLQAEPLDVPDNFELVKVSTSKSTGQQWLQYLPKKESDVSSIDFTDLIKKHIKPIDYEPAPKLDNAKDFDRLIITDTHIGMETDKYNTSMYAIKWDKEQLDLDAELIVKTTIEEKESNLLIIDDYGDLMDGFDGKTTRGGHDLPQNMTNKEAFDCAVDFKINLVEKLLKVYPSIRINNICNDNHSGDFGYFVNKMVKDILEIKYKNVNVTNHNKFINHYTVNKVAFAITHGKDDKSLKFGFKPHLKPDSIEKIDQYCKHNDLYRNSELVIFCKGDSHQALFDMCSSDDFYYFNYPALSPSSQWVQNNFKKGRRGFFLESYKGTKIYLKPNFIK